MGINSCQKYMSYVGYKDYELYNAEFCVIKQAGGLCKFDS